MYPYDSGSHPEATYTRSLRPHTRPADIVRFTLSGDQGIKAKGEGTDEWSQLASILRAEDNSKVEDCNEDIDTLLVFAGLFSAVLTAFNIESYKTLQQDPCGTSASTLQRISQQLESFHISNGYVNSSLLSPNPSSFHPTPSAVRINILWFLSLVFSLISASLAILVKQWLREFRSGKQIAPDESIRVRHYRYTGLLKWHVFDIAALLPFLLHISLFLFLIGLSDFLTSLHPIVGWFITGVIAIWLSLYAGSIVAPAFFAGCPYTVPFMKAYIRATRRALWQLRQKFPWYKPTPLPNYYDFPGDEKGVRRDKDLDIPAFTLADEMLMDDPFTEYILQPCLHGAGIRNTVLFVRRMVQHRLGHSIQTLELCMTGNLDFSRLSTRSLMVSTSMLLDALNYGREWSSPWTHEAWVYLIGACYHRDLGSTKNMVQGLGASLLHMGVDCVQEYLWTRLRFPSFVPPSIYPAFRLDTLQTTIGIARAARNLVEQGEPPLQLFRLVLELVFQQLIAILLVQTTRYELLHGTSAITNFYISAKAIRDHETWDRLMNVFALTIRQQLSEKELSQDDSKLVDIMKQCVGRCKDINEHVPRFIRAELVNVLSEFRSSFQPSDNSISKNPDTLFPILSQESLSSRRSTSLERYSGGPTPTQLYQSGSTGHFLRSRRVHFATPELKPLRKPSLSYPYVSSSPVIPSIRSPLVPSTGDTSMSAAGTPQSIPLFATLSIPEAFFLPPPPPKFAFVPFAPAKIQDTQVEDPVLPQALASNTVRDFDWSRFMTDLVLAWSGRLSVTATDIVEDWNVSYFKSRRIKIWLLPKSEDKIKRKATTGNVRIETEPKCMADTAGVGDVSESLERVPEDSISNNGQRCVTVLPYVHQASVGTYELWVTYIE